MNAGKRKREPHPLARFFPFLQGGWRGLVLSLILLGLLVGGGVYAWQQWGAQITHGDEYWVVPERIEITPAPKWVRTDIKADVMRDCGLTKLSLWDKQLTIKIHQAFSSHYWVDKVLRVSKYPHPARVVVELSYRQPVAMVEVVTKGEPGLLPVDANGVLLPPKEFVDQTQEYLRIVAPETSPAGLVGNMWGDPRVHGGARIAAALQESWKPLGLYRIVASPPEPGNKPAKPAEPVFELLTRAGARVLWGPAPVNDTPSEKAAAQKKVARLVAHAQAQGSLGTSQQSVAVDLRVPPVEPRSAQDDAPAQKETTP